MKILCLLLSVYVLLLSAKPCCADKDCQNNRTNVQAGNHKVPAKEKECGGCSPFFTCGSCVGFVLSRPLTITLPLLIEPVLKHNSCYEQEYIEQVTLSIWQPPQLG